MSQSYCEWICQHHLYQRINNLNTSKLWVLICLRSAYEKERCIDVTWLASHWSFCASRFDHEQAVHGRGEDCEIVNCSSTMEKPTMGSCYCIRKLVFLRLGMEAARYATTKRREIQDMQQENKPTNEGPFLSPRVKRGKHESCNNLYKLTCYWSGTSSTGEELCLKARSFCHEMRVDGKGSCYTIKLNGRFIQLNSNSSTKSQAGHTDHRDKTNGI